VQLTAAAAAAAVAIGYGDDDDVDNWCNTELLIGSAEGQERTERLNANRLRG